jgi:hypothetical protein
VTWHQICTSTFLFYMLIQGEVTSCRTVVPYVVVRHMLLATATIRPKIMFVIIASSKNTEPSITVVLFFGRVRKIAKRNCQIRHVCLSVCLSVGRPAWGSAPTGRVSQIFIFEYFSKICRKFSSFIKI